MSAIRELLDLYGELDAELLALHSSCRACGRCCDFSTHENVLYASRLERDLLGLAGEPDWTAGDQVCPFLAGGRCMARRERTLGCRTHFCEDRAGLVGRDLYEKYRRRIAVISARHGIEWDYAPVLRKLKEGEI